MGPEDRGIVEELHPLQLTGACLVADRLEFRYRLDGRHPDRPGRITRARLVGSGVDIPLTEVMPGMLQAAIPECGGTLSLRVEAVEGCAEGVPPLPWDVGVRLAPEALADYLSAVLIQATAEFPEGVVVRVGRVLRRADSVVVFWDGYLPGSDISLTGDIQGDLLVGSEPFMPSTYQFGPHGRPSKLRPGPKGKAASVMQIAVQAVAYVGKGMDGPLVWCIRYGRLEAPGEWRLALTVPTERPSALAPDSSVATGGMQIRLAEVWLARSQTVLLFEAATGGLDLMSGLELEDDSGHRYQATGASSDSGRTECRFEPLPGTVGRVVVTSRGAGLHVHGPIAIPLEPGAKGRAVRAFPGHPLAGWASADGTGVSSSQIVVEIPDVVPLTAGDAAMPVLRAWLSDRAAPALRMQFEPAKRDALSPLDSHLAGPPFWPAGEPWPVCGQCDRPLAFIGQVRLDGEGPPRIGDAELLTFHYCLECFAYGPEQASAYRLRLYKDVAATPLTKAPMPDTDEVDYAHWDPVPCAVTMVSVQSIPHWEDAKAQLGGVELGDGPWEAYNAEGQALTGAPNIESRLGGYPDWIQGSYWPDCPACGVRMQLIWQLDSERETGLMWGDSGRVYIFACPSCCNDQSLVLITQSC